MVRAVAHGAPAAFRHLAFGTVLLAAFSCIRHQSQSAPPDVRQRVDLLGAIPADGTTGVPPEIDTVELRFARAVPGSLLEVSLQPLGGLAGAAEPTPTTRLVTAATGTTGVVQCALPELATNHGYRVVIAPWQDTDTEFAGAYWEFSTGIHRPAGPTQRVRGTVLDESGQALSGVLIEADATGELTTTDVDGQFALERVPVGEQTLAINAHPYEEREGFATLHFPVRVDAGYEAALRQPVYLPRITGAHRVALNSTGVTLVTHPDVPGLVAEVDARSARSPDGRRPRWLAWVRVSDTNPAMAPPPATTFLGLYSLQPPGVVFDVPARVSYPVAVEVPPGVTVPLTHYDAAARRWVAFATGRVEDVAGIRVVRSLPGQGLLRSAWSAPTPTAVYTDVVGDLDPCDLTDAAVRRRAMMAQFRTRMDRMWRDLARCTGTLAACLRGVPTSAQDLADKVEDFAHPGYGETIDEILETWEDLTGWLECHERFVVCLREQVQPSHEDLRRQYERNFNLRNDPEFCDEQQRQQWQQAQELFGQGAAGGLSGASHLPASTAATRTAAARLREVHSAMGAAIRSWVPGGDRAAMVASLRSLLAEWQPPAGVLGSERTALDGMQAALGDSLDPMTRAIELLASLFSPAFPCVVARPGAVTDLGVLGVIQRPLGAQVGVMGRFGLADRDGRFRIPGVPAGILIGGGLAQVHTLCASVALPAARPGVIDEEQDGLPDDWERHFGLGLGRDDSSEDPDQDGLANLLELLYYGDPRNPDSDGDGVRDGDQVGRGGDARSQGGSPHAPALATTSPAIVSPSTTTVTLRGDGFGSDRGGIEVLIGTTTLPSSVILDVTPNAIELQVPSPFIAGDVVVFRGGVGSNALFLDADTDADGLGDQRELALGTNPRHPDTDGDGLLDGEEIALGADPRRCDTDGDGLEDGFEVLRAGSDPLDADTDHDGVMDSQEDSDGDGLLDLWEQRLGTDPRLADPVRDTDRDGLPDAAERLHSGDPTDPDTDDDGLLDRAEVDAGLAVDQNDTDGDGLSDGSESTGLGNPVEPEDHQRLEVGNDQTIRLTGRNVVRQLIVHSGGTLTTVPASALIVNRIEVHAEEILIEAGGRISALGMGYRGGNRLGQGNRGFSFGNRTEGSFDMILGAGSHGGGGHGTNYATGATWGLTYGRFDRPETPGAGGNGNDYTGIFFGGDGGGVVRLVAERVQVDGLVDASGGSTVPHQTCDPYGCHAPAHTGPGAGGSVWVTTGEFIGVGSVAARGGNASLAGSQVHGHGAGGGRIAVETRARPAVVRPALDARGGQGFTGFGASGTVFEREGANAVGSLTIVAVPGVSPVVTDLPGFGERAVEGVGSCRLRLAGPALPRGRFVGQDLYDRGGRRLASIVAHDANTLDLTAIVTLPDIGDFVQIGHAAGVLRGQPGTAVRWRGCLQSHPDQSGHFDLIGDWVGDQLDIGPGVVSCAIADGGLEVATMRQSGAVDLVLEDLRVERARWIVPEPGRLFARHLLAASARLQVGRAVRGEFVELQPGTVWSAVPPRSGMWLPIEIAADAMLVAGPLGNLAAARIDASGSGFVGGYADPPANQAGETYPGTHTGGSAQSTWAGGGSHGGRGGDATVSARVYGAPDLADLPGGGGGMNSYRFGLNPGGNGGGVVLLRVTTLVLDGEVRADGAPGGNYVRYVGPEPCVGVGVSGAGAGGSIRIDADDFSGLGLVRALGGGIEPVGDDCGRFQCGFDVGRGGGGGRIAIRAGRYEFGGELMARGGLGSSARSGCNRLDTSWSGGAGTIWILDGAGRFGRLWVDNGGISTSFVSTPLVASAIGEGVGQVDATGRRVQASNPFFSGAAGAYPLVGRYVVIDGDTSRPRRIAAHGTDWFEVDDPLPANQAVAFRGALFFDSLVVRGNARADRVGEWLVVPGGGPVVEAGAELR